MRTVDWNGQLQEEIAFVGIIDTLTSYHAGKKLETWFKSWVYDKHQISSVPPDEYCERFNQYLESIVQI